MNPWPVDADVRGGPPAAPGACRPRRRSRSTASPTCATCSSAPAPARPPRAWPPAALAKVLLRAFGVEVLQPRGPDRHGDARPRPRRARAPRTSTRVDESPVRCLDAEAERRRWSRRSTRPRKANESLGGVFEVVAFGVVPGLGSHVSWDTRLDGRLAQGGDVDPGDEGRRDRRRVRARRPRGFAGPRRDLLLRGARLLPRDQPRRRPRGRHDHRRSAGGARRDEAASHADQAAAQRRHLQPRSPPRRLRERTDSCTVPAAAVVAEAMVALVLADAYRGEVRRRPHGRHAGDAARPTRSASDGGADRRRATRRRRRPRAAARWCSWASWAPGKSSSARSVAAELRRATRSTPTASSRRRSASRSRRSSTARARPAFRAARGGGGARPARARARADGVVALGGGATGSERVREALRAPHRRSPRGRAPEEAWRRATGKGRPLARDRGRFDQLHADRASRLRVAGPRRAAAGGRDVAARALAALVALREARAAGRHRSAMVWARGRVGRVPGLRGARPDRSRLLLPAATAAVRGHRRERGRATTASRRSTPWPWRPARSTRRSPRPRRVLRRLAAGGRRARRHGRGRWRRRGGGPRRASAPRSTSAACATCRCRRRWWRRSTRPTAARPAWTCPRARTTPASTTSPRPCSATRRRSPRCRPRSWRRATPRWSRRR